MQYRNRIEDILEELKSEEISSRFPAFFWGEIERGISGISGRSLPIGGLTTSLGLHRELFVKHFEGHEPDPLQESLLRFLRAATSQLASAHSKTSKTESEELRQLRKEVRALKKRLDDYDAIFEEALRLDKEIEAEIEAIEAEPVNPLDYKPEDWLPTGEEMEKLLDEE